MINSSQKLAITLKSLLSLIFAFAVVQLLQRGFISLGAYISDFNGQLLWRDFVFSASSDKWSLSQVLWIYLFPYIGFLVIYIVIFLRRSHPIKIPQRLLLVYGWAYMIILALVFFLPLWEILNRKGIYFALEWINFTSVEQVVLGILLMLFFIIRVFRFSSIFSTSLILPSNQFINPHQIIGQIPFLWYIPFLFFAVCVVLISGLMLTYPNNYLLGGIFIAIILNTPIITKYKVIVT